MWNHTMLGTDVYHIVHWFFAYSILGWCVESIYMSICNKKLTNRGFIKGPICPIYGVGALTVYFLLEPFSGNYISLYIMGALVATFLEYITALVMIRTFGNVWWDYEDKPFNYKGILCLESTIAWGFYTLFLFIFLQNMVERLVTSYTVATGKLLGTAIITYFVFDFTHSLYKAKSDSIPKNVEEFRASIRGFIYRG